MRSGSAGRGSDAEWKCGEEREERMRSGSAGRGSGKGVRAERGDEEAKFPLPAFPRGEGQGEGFIRASLYLEHEAGALAACARNSPRPGPAG
jgi:hypothetical protein